MFESLNKNDVPLLIFSAGVGDILKEVLRQKNLLFPNMKIIANFMQFDEKVCNVFLIQGSCSYASGGQGTLGGDLITQIYSPLVIESSDEEVNF